MASTSSTGSKRKIEDTSMGAFHGIAPSASTSASKRIQKPSYDVFINHRGPDVKHTLATVLYAMLTGMSLSVFLDSEESEYGDFLPRTIEAAMTSALLHIAIFSKRYAESPWCLAELSFMLKSGTKIIPIFYHVDPSSDLRWVDQGKGMYVEAFKEHERKGRYSREQLREWKSALHNVSHYHGQIIKTNEDEMRLLKNIVNCVLKEINNSVPLVVAKHPAGLKEVVEDFKANTLRSVHDNEDAQIVGIWGMGGSGKTTLAKELYNEISSSMERSSFVFDVRDAATKGLLHEKQKKLLNDLGVQNLSFDNIEEGMRNLSRGLRSVRVLIVLDDVDNIKQLDALLPTKDSLEKGSLVIVTTRVRDILKSWQISSIYKMRPLDPLYAKQLFCWHAFLKSYPPDGFKELVQQFIEVCNGLPLSLKVYGAQLYGESRKHYWESQLRKISKILSEDIKQILKISYDTLDDEEKKMFLDTACFFIGQESSLAIEVWNGMGWTALSSWEGLLNRCLVELDNRNCITMHDHLRDLGRDIANKQSPYCLWFPQQIIDVTKQVQKTIAIQRIIATSNQIIWHTFKYKEGIDIGEIIATSNQRSWYWNKYEDGPEMFTETDEVDKFPVCCSHGELRVDTNGGIWSLTPSLVGLKYLVFSGDYFNQVMGDVSRELVWLRWFQIGQRNLLSGLPLRNLRVLELYEKGGYRGEHHLEELWGETNSEIPVQLRQLLISHCHKFQGFPKSIGHLKHLKKIIIIGGRRVTSLPDEFCFLQSLEHLVLRGCEMLSSLPNNFGNLSNLRHLCLYSCVKLRRLPATFKNLKLLEHLSLENSTELTFTSEDLNFLENITKLKYLNLLWCKQLEGLPRHITNQASLRDLYFSGTSLRELPDNIGQLSRLTEMNISKVLLASLPTSLGDLSSLTNLHIQNCPELECLPDSLGNLSSLTNLHIQNCPELECLPDSLGNLSSLMKLSISSCPGLKCLPDFLGDLSSLTSLNIEKCPEAERAGVKSLNNLQQLRIDNCPISELDFRLSNLKSIDLIATEVCRISFSEDCCPHLEDLYVCNNYYLKEIEALPRTLDYIYLADCKMLKNIPSFAGLISLRIFTLKDCYGIEKIEGLEKCTTLQILTVETCLELPGIESLEHMQNLKELKLSGNNGSVIRRCLQSIQKWPDEEIIICAPAVPDAASLVHSLLSPSLIIVDSISYQNIQSNSQLVRESMSDGDSIMIFCVINCVSSQMTAWIELITKRHPVKVEKGRRALIGVFTVGTSKRGLFGIYFNDGAEGEVEKGFVLRGAKKATMEAVRSLLPLLL